VKARMSLTGLEFSVPRCMKFDFRRGVESPGAARSRA
jgi:hypothetical protein